MRIYSVFGPVIVCHINDHISFYPQYTGDTWFLSLLYKMVKTRHSLVSHKSSHLVSIKAII